MTKTCAFCGELNVLKAAHCSACGEAFPPPQVRAPAPGRDASEAMASVDPSAVRFFKVFGVVAAIVIGAVFFVALFYYGAHATP